MNSLSLEIDLLTSLKTGNQHAMEKIYHEHWEHVFDAALKRIGCADAAQDITQEIFISLWENKDKIDVRGDLGAYLHGAVKFRIINYFRSVATKEGHKKELALLLRDEYHQSADSRIITKDLSRQVDAAIALLPEKMRQVVYLSRKQEKTIQEIALETNVSVQTVKNQITTALKVLKKNLSYFLVLAFLMA